MSLSLVSGKLAFLHDGYIAAIENCCSPMVVKHTSFATPIVSLLLGVPRSTRSSSYRTLYLSTIANTRDCTWQMPKTCYCGLQSSRRICKYALIMPLLAHIICTKKHTQEGVWLLYIIFHNHNYQGGIGKLIYKALILGNKQLLSNMIDRKAT